VYASKTRREKFSGHDENCPQNASDLEDSLVTSSRPPGRSQKRPDDRTSNDGVAAQAADGSQRTAGAADEQCHSINSVEAMRETQSTELNRKDHPTASSFLDPLPDS